MDCTASASRVRSGDATTGAAGCRVRRLSDGAVLPTVFSYDDIRPASTRPDAVPAPASASALPIRDAVLDAVDLADGELVLDLDGVEFLDSYGIRLLVTVRRRA